MYSTTQYQCRRCEMWGKFSQIHPEHSLFSVTKNDLSWLNYLFMARFQLISMFSEDKNELQMITVSVDVAKCEENFTNSPSALAFCLLQKMFCLGWTSYSWQSFNSLVCPLMLRTNYWCVQSLNISVDVAKCVPDYHKFAHYTHFLSVT